MAETPPSPDPLYLQVAQSFEAQIQHRALTPGDRLPSVRELSRKLGISVGTAVAAYEWLERQGSLEARPRSGFYVADRRPAVAEPEIEQRSLPPTRVALAELLLEIQASSNRPEISSFGEAVLSPELLPTTRFHRAVRKATSVYLRSVVSHDERTSSLRLRRQIARLAYRLALDVRPEEVVLTHGALEAQNLAIRSVTRPGDVVAVESPGCFEKLQSLEALGLQALEVATRPHHGPDLEQLEKVIRRHKVKALLMSGCCQSPLGCRIPDSTKEALVSLAERMQVPIVEDDCFGDLAFSAQRPKPYKSFDSSGGVLYCGTYSHLVAPQFPFGWLLPGRFRAEVESLSAISFTPAAMLPQLAFAEFLESGAYERHLRKLIPILEQSTRSLASAVAKHFPRRTRMVVPDGGFFLWVQLPQGVSGSAVYRAALEEGIAIVPGIAFSPHRHYEDCIRLTCGWRWSGRAEQAVAKLGSLVAQLIEQPTAR